RVAPRDDLLDVVPHRTDRARDHADAPRRRRERALAFDRKESLGGEPPLERFEPEVRVARASRPDVVDLKLAPPVLGVELDVAVSPLSPRSVSVTVRTTDAGISTPIGDPSYSLRITVIPSVR